MIQRTLLGISFLFAVAFGQPLSNDLVKTQADSFHALGNSFIKGAKYDSAREAFQFEVKIREKLLDSLGLANGLNSLCQALDLETMFEEGLAAGERWWDVMTMDIIKAKFKEGLAAGERALSICKLTVGENDTLAARSLNNIGSFYYYLGDYKKSLENHNKALTIRLKALGPEHPDVAASYYNIGLVYYNLGDREKALENYNKALTIRLKALGPEHPDVALSYNIIGRFYYDLRDYKKALEYYNRALTIRLKALGPDHRDVAASYYNIGLVYYRLFDFKKALANFNKALTIQLKALGPEHLDVALCYNIIGIVYLTRGDYQKALENYNKALAIRLKVLAPKHPDVAYSYCNIGDVYDALGDYEKALEYLNKALAIRIKASGPAHTDVLANYNSIGNVYRALGDYEKALEYYNKALTYWLIVYLPAGLTTKEAAVGYGNIAAGYDNIGTVYYDIGDYEKGLENYNKALSIRLKVFDPDHLDVANSYNSLGNLYCVLGDYEKALENDNKALAIWFKVLGPEHPDVAYSYNSIGNVYRALRNYEKALEYDNKALAIQLKALGADHPDVAVTYFEISKVFRAKKDLNSALGYLKKSIEITEKVGGGVSSEELKKTYTESVRQRYDEIITLLLEMGRSKEAFEYYERSKSKLLQDELNKEGVEIGRGEVRKKLNQVRSLSNQVGVLGKQVIDEKSKPKLEQNKTKIENLTRLRAQTKGEFFQLVNEIKQKNPDYGFAVEITPKLFASIQKDLPPGTKVVMYYEAKDVLYILLITKDNWLAKSVAVSKDSLDVLVKSFRQTIDTTQIPTALNKTVQADDPGLKTILTTLYQYLIQPIQEELKLATEITIIPSGTLYYLPFEALARNDGTRLKYLLEDAPISYLAPAEFIHYVEGKTRKTKGNYDLLLVGNPTGADLPAADSEVKAISALYPRSRCFLESEATKSTVKAETPSYEILHLATHAYLDTKKQFQSYIYLTRAGEDDGRWTMAEVMNETWNKMELVTLSACQTAIGGDMPGQEMESMAEAFSIAGAPSIVATLWPVYDPSTKDLMVGFYTNLKTMSKVEALRQAQLSLIHSSQYSHPYFWAPFILIGDWR